MKQDGSAQQTVSIDQPPRIVIDAIRHGTPQFVRDVLAKGGIETIDVLKTELSDEKLPTGSGERVGDYGLRLGVVIFNQLDTHQAVIFSS